MPRKPLTPEERAELEALYGKVEAGIRWVMEQDPTGRFYLWAQSELKSYSRIPGQDEATITAWKTWCNGYGWFKRYFERMEYLEARCSDTERAELQGLSDGLWSTVTTLAESSPAAV